jgi:Kef-type K+ transport system membrane component KefB
MIEFLQGLVDIIPKNYLFLVSLGSILIIGAIFAFIVRAFKQPLIPAYIITGILVGPVILGLIKDSSLILSLSEIGVAFLIFTAGLELKFSKLKEVGKTASIGGILQVVLLFLIGFLVSLLLGFSGKAPIYIGLAVAFSSTMIVVKILSDKREINSLHGRLIIGILLIQDIAAIIALIILSSDLSINSLLIAFTKAVLFAAIAFILSKVINPVFRIAAKTPELLLLVSISFLFLFSIGAIFAKLSLIIGAFLAGVSLANSDYKTEIQGKISPIRDFFAVIFFVALGMQLKLIYLEQKFLILLFVLLILVLIIKPFITMYLVRLFGYKKITAFLTGNSLAQTSEFSLIIVILGLSLRQIDNGLFSIIVLLTILTMSITTYTINYEKKLFEWLGWQLGLLDRLKSKKEELEYLSNDSKKIIIFGCHRMGSLFLKEFEKEKKDILVVDYNPEIIRSLIEKKIPCIYGDFANEEVLEKANAKSAEMIISTIADVDDNKLLIKKTKEINPNALVFVVAGRISEAMLLYKAGADYVILPQVIGGQKGYDAIKKIRNGKVDLNALKKNHIKYLDSIHNILY